MHAVALTKLVACFAAVVTAYTSVQQSAFYAHRHSGDHAGHVHPLAGDSGYHGPDRVTSHDHGGVHEHSRGDVETRDGVVAHAHNHAHSRSHDHDVSHSHPHRREAAEADVLRDGAGFGAEHWHFLAPLHRTAPSKLHVVLRSEAAVRVVHAVAVPSSSAVGLRPHARGPPSDSSLH